MVKESSLAMNYRLLSQESSSSHAVILLPSKVTAGLSCRAPNKFNQTRKLKQLIKKTHECHWPHCCRHLEPTLIN